MHTFTVDQVCVNKTVEDSCSESKCKGFIWM